MAGSGTGEGKRTGPAAPLASRISDEIDRAAHVAMTIVVDVVVIVVGLALLWEVGYLVFQLVTILREGARIDAFGKLIEGALTVFVFIEIFESFLYYMRKKRLDLRLVLDLSLIIVLREVWLAGLRHADWTVLAANAALVLAIGAVRIGLSVTQRKGEPDSG